MMATAVYDKIGKTYDQTRKADPGIISRILMHLSPHPTGHYLDIGCGSGNYTEAVFKRGFNICGLDVSEEMLAKAKNKNPQIEWVKGDARSLPFPDRVFEGAVCILATHHIKDIEMAFKEVYGALKKGNFVIFTSFPEQMQMYWLKEYFPHMMEKAVDVMHTQENMFQALHSAGFRTITTDKFFISNDLQDGFLQAGKYRPHLYLDPLVRAGISTFALENNQEEIARGCERLQEDIASGEINQVIQSHESERGDYTFVIGQL
jgi:ubiquinone/menaquinone biosynthesis C-methylase UbiE